MPEDDKREIDEIIDRHNDAFGAFRDASDAFDAAVKGVGDTIVSLRSSLDAVHAANRAQGEAIDAIRAANQAALRLLRRAS
jgi:hypothetical protein